MGIEEIKESKTIMEKQRVSEFKSNNASVSQAVEKIALRLTENESESFYVSGIEYTENSVMITLFHHDIATKLKENKKNHNEWVVLPPLSAIPDLAKQYRYFIKNDLLIECSGK